MNRISSIFGGTPAHVCSIALFSEPHIFFLCTHFFIVASACLVRAVLQFGGSLFYQKVLCTVRFVREDIQVPVGLLPHLGIGEDRKETSSLTELQCPSTELRMELASGRS